MRNLFLRAAVSLGAGCVAFACADKKSASDAGSQSVAYVPSLWQKRSIVVCWVTPKGMHPDQLSEDVKDVAKRAVTREYNGRTGISFVGWKSCDETSNPDLRVTDYGNDSEPTKRGDAGTIGALSLEQIHGVAPSGMQRSPVRLNMVSGCMGTYAKGGNSLNACVALTALHEFGHVAGLRHEHVHPKSTCVQYREDLVVYGMGAKDHQYSTDYDPRSVMDYCYYDEVFKTQLPADQIRLSDKDVAGLNLLYPPGGARSPSPTTPSATGATEEGTVAPKSAPGASQPAQEAPPPTDGAPNTL